MNEHEVRYPRIGVDYILDEVERPAYEPCFDQAAVAYGSTRTAGEYFTYEKKLSANYLLISFGQTVLRASSYADMGNQVDIMRADIELLAGLEGHEAALEEMRAGNSITGSLPTPE